jgi:CAAX amino terminal protease family.
MKHLERALDRQNSFLKYFGMTLIIFLGASTIGYIPLIIIVLTKTLSGNIPEMSSNTLDFSGFGISNNIGYLLLLLGYVSMFFAFKWLVKVFHKRTLNETINGRNYIRRNRIYMGMIVWGALMALTLIIGLITNPDNYEFQFHTGKFIFLLLLTLFILPFQTSFEEIFFRGYLSQGIAASTKNRWWTLIIISLAFGLIHSANPEVKEFGFWISMPQYILMGLILGIVSMLDDGIEIAIGIHYMNNAFLALFTTHSASALQTDALFVMKEMNPKTELIWMIVYSFTAIGIFAAVYKWNFGIMNKKVAIETPPLPQ